MRALITALVAGVLLVGAAARTEGRQPTFGRDGNIHGYVVDPAGQGVSAVVALCTLDGGQISRHQADKNLRGRFDINRVFPGRYVLKVLAVPSTLREDCVPGDPVEVEVRPGKVSRPRLILRAERPRPIDIPGVEPGR